MRVFGNLAREEEESFGESFDRSMAPGEDDFVEHRTVQRERERLLVPFSCSPYKQHLEDGLSCSADGVLIDSIIRGFFRGPEIISHLESSLA